MRKKRPAVSESGTHQTDGHDDSCPVHGAERITRLVAMVCIALVWAYLVGEHKDLNIKPIGILNQNQNGVYIVDKKRIRIYIQGIRTFGGYILL